MLQIEIRTDNQKQQRLAIQLHYLNISNSALVHKYSLLTAITFSQTLPKSLGFPPSTFKSNVSRRRLLAPTIGDMTHWTLREFSRRLAAPVVLVLSVGFVEHTCTPSKIPCTIAEFRTTSNGTLTLIHLSKSSKWQHRT